MLIRHRNSLLSVLHSRHRYYVATKGFRPCFFTIPYRHLVQPAMWYTAPPHHES